jgi:hypothetical protein
MAECNDYWDNIEGMVQVEILSRIFTIKITILMVNKKMRCIKLRGEALLCNAYSKSFLRNAKK